MTKFQSKKGMTLLEVVIAMAIIAICMSAILLGTNVIRIQMGKNLALAKAKGMIAAEKQRILDIGTEGEQFTALDTMQLDTVTINGVSKGRVFHAFSDTNDKRTEYFAVYPGFPGRITLKDKSKFYLHPVFGDRIKVKKNGVELTKGTDFHPSNGDWALANNYQNIHFYPSAGIVTGNIISVTYLPSTGATEGLVEECFTVSSNKKSSITLTNPASPEFLPLVYAGFEITETFEIHDFKQDSKTLLKEVGVATADLRATCASFLMNPASVRGGYVYPLITNITYPLPFLPADKKTIDFSPDVPQYVLANDLKDEIHIFTVTPQPFVNLNYEANSSRYPLSLDSVKTDTGGIVIPYSLEVNKKRITFTPAIIPSNPETQGARIIYSYFRDPYYVEVKYLHLVLIPSTNYVIDESDHRKIKFAAPQPINAPALTTGADYKSQEEWPYHVHVKYMPDEVGGPPLTDTTVITQVELTAPTLEKVTVTIYPKNQINAPPITQGIFFIRRQ